ncbi:MAG: class I SAM-dependent methyltransferase family protein, partial [Candidatus Micrarchaeota archaeon]|nr:class I SAM-dependent methyltransferase family protein [Candidatus Micrarchaeota archaeon]
EKVKTYLARQKLMDNNYRIIRSDKFIYFPLSSAIEGKSRKTIESAGGQIADFKFGKNPNIGTYSSVLGKHAEGNYQDVAKGYDLVGDIAIVESDSAKSAKAMAKAIMKVNRNIKTVLRKAGAVGGRYRTRKYAYVAGERKYDTIYRENGASFKLDLRKTFFSTRLAFERDRIRKASRDGENVMVMFAGAGPFAVEIAKMRKKSRVVAMELNKKAYEYMLENVRLNHADNVVPELGDVKVLVKKHKHFADRIVMPLPKDSYNFLDCVLIAAKPRCIVHYYGFGNRSDAFDYHIKKLHGFFARNGRRFRVLYKRTARTYSPSQIEVAIDFLIY